ncbi:MAG: hypothetical protein Q8O51_02095 [bacterium]|nr:hypothetical protein [bacterium]
MQQVDAATLIIRKYVFNKPFRQVVEGIRKAFGIPKDGFVEQSEYDDWTVSIAVADTLPTSTIKYQYAVEKLLNKHLPIVLQPALESFIAYPQPGMPFHGSVGIDDVSSHRGYLRIVVGPYASEKNITDFITKRWPEIEKRLKAMQSIPIRRMPRNHMNELLLAIDKRRREKKSWGQIRKELKPMLIIAKLKILSDIELAQFWFRLKNFS